MTKAKLNICPCGEVPEELILKMGEMASVALASGSCCGEWHIEFETKFNRLNRPEAMERAIKAWNFAMRSIELARSYPDD